MLLLVVISCQHKRRILQEYGAKEKHPNMVEREKHPLHGHIVNVEYGVSVMSDKARYN